MAFDKAWEKRLRIRNINGNVAFYMTSCYDIL
jgi:hypothetical protein